MRENRSFWYGCVAVIWKSLVAGVLLLGSAGFAPASAASSFRLTDAEGVTHYTNAPTDPRYQNMPGMSGTAAGWLRVPAAGSGYGEQIREIAARYGVSPRLVEAVIRVESAFNPRALSPKGAQGLMQLMPQTALSLGVRNAFDPIQNIDGGVRHLRYLLDRYPGNVQLALAAYNAGQGAVSAYGGRIPPYPETQEYVRKVLHLHGHGEGTAQPPQVIYRHEDPDGTITFSNIPPPNRARLR
jgi:soluble lytic murein transglycosylase-like protein